MHIRTSLAVRALRGARTAPAAVCGAVTLPLALAAGGPSAAVPAVAAVTLSVLLATALTGRPRPGLTGIARSWARAHPWRYAAAPAAVLTAALLVVDAATGWPYIGAILAGLAVPVATRIAARHPPGRTPRQPRRGSPSSHPGRTTTQPPEGFSALRPGCTSTAARPSAPTPRSDRWPRAMWSGRGAERENPLRVGAGTSGAGQGFTR